MQRALVDALCARLGVGVADLRPVSGGDINEACEARLDDGRRVFVKTNRHADPRMFACEAEGLEWLREADALRVPQVLAVSAEGTPAFLVLELVERGPRAADFEARLGRGLATLHRAGAPGFGFASDNFIGSLPQSNRPHATWAEFYYHERLAPMLERAIRAGAPSSWRGLLDRLAARLPSVVGPAEPPARLHGDLWSGNVMSDAAGQPVIIDPAVYGGHREMDLAMLRLFGSPSRELFAAYEEVWPLAPEYEERVRLYQLYPLLVHVALFGGSYVGAAESALRAYL